MPSYKLKYFDAWGRGELARVLFYLGGQEFEDVRIQMKDWPALKESTPFGQMPVLDIDGKAYAQTVAIINYLARELGYYGKTNIENLAIDQVVCLVQDAINAAVRAMFESPEDKREEMAQKYLQEELPKFLEKFEKLLVENGTGYFVGDTMTLADLCLWDFISGLENRLKTQNIVTPFPKLTFLFDKINNNDKIKAYCESRRAATSMPKPSNV